MGSSDFSMTDTPQIWHWRQEDYIKNFGDYLAAFLTREMFEPISWHDGPVHVIGSVIADFLVPEAATDGSGRPVPKTVFWGCGARDENGLSDDRIEQAEILAVRGPLTASVLKLGATKPQGDIALFLPALYKPQKSGVTKDKTVCIPHFWDHRPDHEFSQSGCDVVLRTNIVGGDVEIRRLIDAIASADFVLSASLHGALVAAAYGVPFGFWDNGHIDLPFKWQDLAAYLSIPPAFHATLEQARVAYENEIGAKLRIPSLWAFLACAPFPLRPDALVKIIRHQLEAGGPEQALHAVNDLTRELSLNAPEAHDKAKRLMQKLGELARDVHTAREQKRMAEEQSKALADRLAMADQLREEAVTARQRYADEQIDAIREKLSAAQAAQETANRLSSQLTAVQIERDNLQTEREDYSAAVVTLSARIGRTLERLQSRPNDVDAAYRDDEGDDELAALSKKAGELLAERNALLLRATTLEDRLSETLTNLEQAEQVQRRAEVVSEQRRLQTENLVSENAVFQAEVGSLKRLLAEQEEALKGTMARNLALSTQVQATGRDIDRWRGEIEEAQRQRDAALGKYERIANSRAWRLVRRSRRIREYFSPFRMKQRGRRVVRILTGKGRKKKPKALPSTPAMPASGHSNVAIFVLDVLGVGPSPALAAQIRRWARDGSDVIACGKIKAWASLPVRTISCDETGAVTRLNEHLQTHGGDVTVVVTDPSVSISGDLSALLSDFERHPQSAALCAAVLNGDMVHAFGAVVGDDGQIVADETGQTAASYTFSSTRPCGALWPTVVALNLDICRHLGPLPALASSECALIAFGLNARSHGLDTLVTPSVSAQTTQTIKQIELPQHLSEQARQLGSGPRRPKVLFADAVTPTPDRDSGSIDIVWFMKIFLRLGYEVTFLPIHERGDAGRYTQDLRQLGVLCPSSQDYDEPWKFLRDQGKALDLCILYRASAACHLIDPVKEFAPQAKVIFDTVDLHFLREQRAAESIGSVEGLAAAEQTKAEEIRIMEASDATILLSTAEYDLVGKIAPQVKRAHISIVREVPGRSKGSEGRSGCMFVGGFKHRPNIDAVHYLCGEIWPEVRKRSPESTLYIIGADAPQDVVELHDPRNGVHFKGFEKSLDFYYENMRINLAPLRVGAGVKGKVVASLAVGLPTIGTPIAVEGMGLEDGIDALVADTPSAFADAVVRLNDDDALWESLSRRSVEAAKARFSVTAAEDRLKELLKDLGLPTSA